MTIYWDCVNQKSIEYGCDALHIVQLVDFDIVMPSSCKIKPPISQAGTKQETTLRKRRFHERYNCMIEIYFTFLFTLTWYSQPCLWT